MSDTVQEAVERLSLLESELSQALEQNGILKDRLEKMKSTLGASFERENRLRSENESSTLQEAQLRFEMKEIRKTLEEELHKRDQEHEQQIHMMEQVKIYCKGNHFNGSDRLTNLKILS